MALVKLVNIGEEAFEGFFNGEKYTIAPDKSGKSFIIVDEKIAKHWLGDWDLKGEEAKHAEAKRVKMYTRSYPDAGWIIDVERVVERQKEEARKRYTPKEVEINPTVRPPDDKEFEDLEEVKSGNVSKDASKESKKDKKAKLSKV